MSVRVTPCDWEPDFSGCTSGPCCADIDTPENAELKAKAGRIASNILWALTGRVYGCCEVTVRPCKADVCCNTSLADFIYSSARSTAGKGNLGVLDYEPTLVGGQVYNLGCGVCGTGCCKCCADCEVKLFGPVCSIVSVQENGALFDADQYRLDDHGTLVVKYRWVPSTTAGRFMSVIEPFPGFNQFDPADRWEFSPALASFNGNVIDYGNGSYGSAGVGGQNMGFTFPTLPDASFTGTFEKNGDPSVVNQFAVAPPNTGNQFASYVYPTDVFGIGSTLVAGDSMLSEVNEFGDTDTRARFTVVSGEFTRVSAQGFEVSDDASFTMEFEEKTTSCFACQDYNKDLGEDGTWGVTYTIGRPVPEELSFAAGLFACELAKAWLNDSNCSLPQRVKNVARPGMNVELFDPVAFANDGLTGLPFVDQVIRALNPFRLASPGRVWHPGIRKGWRRETP